MAPPKNRRPGYSRRAQYSIFISYVLALLGAAIGAVLLLISIADPRGFAVLRTAGAEITAPIGRTLAELSSGIGNLGTEIAAYFNAAAKNAQMQRELEVARREIVEARALKRENERLLELLDLVEEVDRVIAKGRLISASISSTRRMATLSVGSASGVEIGMPVRAPEGLVGRILEVGPTTARILLVSDKDNVTPVKRARDGLAAFVTGRGDGTVDIQPINLATNSLKPGDLFITSGNGGLYSPNIPVAFVVEKTVGGALGRPLANPAQVAHVIVQPIFQLDFKAAVAAETKTGAQDSESAPSEAAP